VTVKDQNGNVLFNETRKYEVYDLHLPSNKNGWLGFDDWDITAMTHINLGLEPFESDAHTFVVPLKKETSSVNVEASFVFHEEEKSIPWKKITKKVEF